MAETILVSAVDKIGKYQELLPQIANLIESESDLIANLANLSAALKETFNWLWVGFYLIKGEQLVLGPFQGPVACTRIGYAHGVCGKVWQLNQVLIVPDVKQFPGHIACSSLAKSEIVLPLYDSKSEIIGVLDIDSIDLACFDQIDEEYLSQIIKLLKFKI